MDWNTTPNAGKITWLKEAAMAGHSATILAGMSGATRNQIVGFAHRNSIKVGSGKGTARISRSQSRSFIAGLVIKPKPPRAQPVLNPTESLATMRTLKAGLCHYPLFATAKCKDPMSLPYCGHPTVSIEKPYCEHHHRRVYSMAVPRDR